MSSFIEGFEKRAEEKKEENKYKRYLKTVGGRAGGAEVIGELAGISALLPYGNEVENRKLMEAFKVKNKRIRAKFFDGLAMPHVRIRPHSGRSVIVVSTKSPLGVLAHEAGHALSFQNKSLTSRLLQGIPRKASIGAGLGLPAALALSDNEKANKIAPYTALLPALHVIPEEISATVRGTNEIYKHMGAAKAIKSLGSTLPALASYAAIPTGMFFGVKKFVENKAKKDQK